MENINPTWKVLGAVRFYLRAGHSVRNSIQLSCATLDSQFEKLLYKWVHSPHQPPTPPVGLTDHQQILLQIFSDGLSGAPILESLEHLEEEVQIACRRELDSHITKLPFLGMVPLMLLIGPAFILLLIGPILSQLLTELSR